MADWKSILESNREIIDDHWVWTGNKSQGYGLSMQVKLDVNVVH